MNRWLPPVLALILLARPATGQPPAADSPPPPAAPEAADSTCTIELRTSPFLDLHFLVRAVAAGRAEAPPIDGFDEAVRIARAITEAGGDRAWALIDGGFTACNNAEDARNFTSVLKEASARPNARMVEPTLGGADLIEALARLEPAFLEKVWPAHREAIDRAVAHLSASLLARQAECFADAARLLGMTRPDVEVPVYLIAAGPPPGGVTYRTRGGLVCIVDVSAHPGTALDEAVFHESLHALDALTAGEATVLNELRSELRGDGSRPGPGWRDVPHAVIFAQAASTIRRVIDPAHQDYGVTGGYYGRVKPAAEAVLPAWAEYTAGRATRAETIARILDDYDPPEPNAQ